MNQGSNFTLQNANESSDSKFTLQSANNSSCRHFKIESVNEPWCSKPTLQSANDSSDSKFTLQSANDSSCTNFTLASVNEPCCSNSRLQSANISSDSKFTLQSANDSSCSTSALESANASSCSLDGKSDEMMSASQSPYNFTDEEETEMLYKREIKNEGIAQQIVCYIEEEDKKLITKRKIFTQHKTQYTKKFKAEIFKSQEIGHEKALISNTHEIKKYIKPERGLIMRDNNIPIKILPDILENTKSENTSDHKIYLDESVHNTSLILSGNTETESNYSNNHSISIQDLLPDTDHESEQVNDLPNTLDSLSDPSETEINQNNNHSISNQNLLPDNDHESDQLNDLPKIHESLSSPFETGENQNNNHSIFNPSLPEGLDDISDDNISDYINDNEPSKSDEVEHISEVSLEPTLINEDYMIRSSHSPVKVQKNINKRLLIEKESVRIPQTILIPHLPMVKPSRKISNTKQKTTKESKDNINIKNDDMNLTLIQRIEKLKTRTEKLKELECRKRVIFNDAQTSPSKAPTVSLPYRNNRSDFLTNTANEQIQKSSIFIPRPRPASQISPKERLNDVIVSPSESPRKELKSILSKTRKPYSAATYRKEQEAIKPSYLRPPGPRARIAWSSTTEQR